MNKDEQVSLERLLKLLGYKENNEKCNNYKFDKTAGANDNIFSSLNLDIPDGFQDINPILFITIGELLGNIISGSMPINVANNISNYLSLLGQIIETCGTQLQYFEIGPGRYYNPKYKNIENPYLSKEECNLDISKEDSINLIKNLYNEVSILQDKVSILEKEIESMKKHK